MSLENYLKKNIWGSGIQRREGREMEFSKNIHRQAKLKCGIVKIMQKIIQVLKRVKVAGTTF